MFISGEGSWLGQLATIARAHSASERSEFLLQNCLPLLEGQAVLYVADRCLAFHDRAMNAGDRSIGEPALYYRAIS